MEESYIEWLVKRKDPIYALPVKIIMVLVLIKAGGFLNCNLSGMRCKVSLIYYICI